MSVTAVGTAFLLSRAPASSPGGLDGGAAAEARAGGILIA